MGMVHVFGRLRQCENGKTKVVGEYEQPVMVWFCRKGVGSRFGGNETRK